MTPDDEKIGAVIAPLYALSSGMTRVVAGKPAVTRLAVLQTVAQAESVRPSEIAGALHLHQSQVTRQIKGLEDEGLIEVVANPEDNRSWLVTVTEAGRAEMARLQEVGMTKWRRYFADWDEEEVAQLARLLTKLHTSIEQDRSAGPRSRRTRRPRR